MLPITIQRKSGVTLHRQLVDQVAALIATGALPAGARLPPVRELATTLGLTRLTVHSAYSELQARGLVESHVGRGSFVARRMPLAAFPAAPDQARDQTRDEASARWQSQGILADLLRLSDRPDLISFAQAAPPPETYPTRELRRALQTAGDDPTALGYGPVAGVLELREQISQVLLERGVVAPSDELLVTAGAQQSIDLALRACTEAGDVVLVEEPTYPGMLEAAARRGQRVVGVPLDAGGIALAALEAACAIHHPRLLYTVPTYHNPTGVSLAAERRSALLRVARAHDLLIFEDDVYGLLGYDGAAPPALKAADTDEAGDGDGRVIYSMSFSKALAPALRLGALAASPERLPRLAAAKQSADLVCSLLLQRALAAYLKQGRFAAHLHRVRALYRARRDAVLTALESLPTGCAWTRPSGGLNVWVTLPEGVDEREFCAAALARGVGVAPGGVFFVQPQRRAAMRLSFGALAPDRIARGVAILGEVLREHLRRHAFLLARANREFTPLV
jgi:GntR family transcriptional regulator/MocR family aminotransferase